MCSSTLVPLLVVVAMLLSPSNAFSAWGGQVLFSPSRRSSASPPVHSSASPSTHSSPRAIERCRGCSSAPPARVGDSVRCRSTTTGSGERDGSSESTDSREAKGSEEEGEETVVSAAGKEAAAADGAEGGSGGGSTGSGKKKSGKQQTVSVHVKGPVASIAKADWDALLRPDDSPFLEWDYLNAIEKSGCAREDKGWQPLHMLVREGDDETGKILGACPLYLKGHSMGEFIFDNQWAEAAYAAGIEYYPKLLVAVPFTPASGARVLVSHDLDEATKDSVRQTVAQSLVQLAMQVPASSVHVNFCSEAEVKAFQRLGYLHRKGMQFHWRNENKEAALALAEAEEEAPAAAAAAVVEEAAARDADAAHVEGEAAVGGRGVGGGSEGVAAAAAAAASKAAAVVKGKGPTAPVIPYRDWTDYMANFSSKRRKKINRERRSVYEDSGVTVKVYRGDAIPDDLFEQMFLLYKTTIDKLMWGRQYLTQELYDMWRNSSVKQNLCFIVAYNKDGEIAAGTTNLVKAGRFYGRYWGAFETIKNLHFEACYYKAIEYCIEEGLQVMEPGAGGGDFKFKRGFDPAVIHSMHYFCNPSLHNAVGNFVMAEGDNIEDTTEYLLEKSAVKARGLDEEGQVKQPKLVMQPQEEGQQKLVIQPKEEGAAGKSEEPSDA